MKPASKSTTGSLCLMFPPEGAARHAFDSQWPFSNKDVLTAAGRLVTGWPLALPCSCQ